MSKKLLLSLFLINFASEQFAETVPKTSFEKTDPIVQIENGKIRGKIDTTIGGANQYYVFQGIPFAEPPLGNLRFEAPEPATNWSGILNTQEYKGDCVQSINFISSGNMTGSEDCLYINVYTPTLTGNNLAVMVWIYGGAFYGGTSGPDLYGPDYLIDNNVIVVTFNYRLGIFGFLSTGDLVAPGNAGLKDQLLALKWVKKNIAKFGGNFNKITIFGESAGAASVAYHLTSPKSAGLFRNGIMESGTSICIWALSRKMKDAVNLVANAYGLNPNDSQLLVEGLKEIDVESLYSVSMNITENLQEMFREGFVFAPIAEPVHPGAFFTDKIHQRLVEMKFHSVPILLGINSMESLYFRQIVEAFYLTNAIEKYDFVPKNLNIQDENETEIVYNKIKDFYFGTEPVYTQEYQAHKFVTVDLFVRSIIETAGLLSNKSKTYFYQFSYVGNLSENSYDPVPGASHFDELFYIWRKDSNETTAADVLMRSRLTKLWTNFAKYSDPTPFLDPLFDYVKWNQSDSIENNLLYIKLDEEIELDLNPFDSDINFWDQLYEEHGYPPFDTY